MKKQRTTPFLLWTACWPELKLKGSSGSRCLAGFWIPPPYSILTGLFTPFPTQHPFYYPFSLVCLLPFRTNIPPKIHSHWSVYFLFRPTYLPQSVLIGLISAYTYQHPSHNLFSLDRLLPIQTIIPHKVRSHWSN